MYDNDQEEFETNLGDEQETELEDRGDEVGDDLPPEDDDEVPLEPKDEAEEPEQEQEQDQEPARGSKTVPHARFNEVNEQYKAERDARLRLEEELARLRGTQPQQQDQGAKPGEQQPPQQPDGFDFKEARRKLREAIYEGDDDLAEQLEEQIQQQTEARMARLAEERARNELEARNQQEAQKLQKQALDEVVADAYKAYPFLDVKSAKANADAIDEVVAMRDLFIRKGDSPAEALAKAVDRVGPRYGEAATDTDKTRRAIIERNMERERRIPPRDGGVGERARQIDYSKLSEDEFDSLPENEKRKARGDFV